MKKSSINRSIAIAAILALTYTSVGFAAGPPLTSALRAARSLGHAEGSTAQRISTLGAGAIVQIKLVTGKSVEGTIVEIGSDTVDIVAKRDGLVHRVAYVDVAELKYDRSTYRTSDVPDLAQARRVATGLVGRHVAVEVAGRSTFRGHVQAAHSDHLVLLLDQANTPFDIRYADVEAIGPNLSNTAKTGLYAGMAVLAATLIFTILELKEEPDI
jgi:hypothetical protein